MWLCAAPSRTSTALGTVQLTAEVAGSGTGGRRGVGPPFTVEGPTTTTTTPPPITPDEPAAEPVPPVRAQPTFTG